MNLRGLEQAAEEQLDTIPPLFIDIEQVRKRDVRVYQALFIIKSTLFNWSRSPVKILQDKLQALGLTLIVFEEDPILFFTLKRRLFGKFRKHFRKYKPLLFSINRTHWQWQVEMIWQILFNRPLQKDSYVLIEILIDLQTISR